MPLRGHSKARDLGRDTVHFDVSSEAGEAGMPVAEGRSSWMSQLKQGPVCPPTTLLFHSDL